MFEKQFVLSQNALATPNLVCDALEALLEKRVSIKDCRHKTQRDWSIFGGGCKYYTTTFEGHFVLKGSTDKRKVSGEITNRYSSGKEIGCRCELTLDNNDFPVVVCL